VGLPEFTDGSADAISGLSAPDDMTVVVEFEQPNPSWLPTLAGLEGFVILPEHVLGDVPHDELESHEYFDNFSVTNGPYTFIEWAPGQHVELERNDDWSLGEAGFERLFIKYVDGDVASAQLETREVQFILEVAPDDVDRLDSLDGIEIQSTTGTRPTFLALMHYEPLLDKRVRQAMVYAIDREGICQLVFDGHCTVPVTNVPQIAPDWAIPTAGVNEYTYDPDRARALLDEAGWDPSTELVFLDWLGSGPEAEALAIIQDNLADVGINWTIENVDLPTLNERNEETPESFNGYWQNAYFALDPDTLRLLYSCDLHFPAGANRGHYCNEELEILLTSGHAEADPNRRAEIYHDAHQTVSDEVPDIYLFVKDFIVAHDTHLKGIATHGEYSHQYRNIGDWRWED
jgi:peptide/nickel transport system substrate-binding protein